MTAIYLILLLLALVCFVVAAAGRTPADTLGRATRYNLVALGLAFWVAVPLIETIRSL